MVVRVVGWLWVKSRVHDVYCGVVSEGTRILISTSTLWIRSKGLQGGFSDLEYFDPRSKFVGYETSRMGRRIVAVFSKDHRTEPHVSRTSGVADPSELELT
ncbi:hypothetical protein M0802_003234 [Mischocyttarus mexicanus]|nr:hypothetical protein M0802_003234 [Mischocyttarus mexicanus]